jgi:hypothetical protein
MFYASESYVAARLAFRSVGLFYVTQPSSYEVERTPDYWDSDVNTTVRTTNISLFVSFYLKPVDVAIFLGNFRILYYSSVSD